LIAEKLASKDFTRLYRAADMLCLQIGDTIIVDSRKGGKEESPEYRIHFQCPWRFVEEGNILLASYDIYNPYDSSLEYDADWAWDVFGRENEASSIFDVKSKEFENRFLPLKIENIYLTDICDLHIDFNKGIHFDTFINCSTKREYYRFLDFHTGEHTVIFEVD
jgi:hypothetical protein